MPDFGFVGAAYEAPSIYQDAQECINFYPEIDPTKAQGERGIIALYPTPGLETVAILPNQEEVRGIRTLSGGTQVLVICGDFAYVMESDYTPKMIGQLNTSTGLVGLADNGVNCYIVDGNDRYAWFISNPSAATFTGSITTTTLTVTVMLSGTIAVGQALFGDGIAQNTVITALGTGTGGIGTYIISDSQTVASTSINATDAPAIFDGVIVGTTLIVSSVTSGTLQIGQTIEAAGIVDGTIIKAFGTGSGGAGTYTVSSSQNLDYGAKFTASIATTVLDVTAVDDGLIANGDYVYGSTVSVDTVITSLGTGAGGVGTYNINNSQTVGSSTIFAAPVAAVVTASITGTTMTVATVASGTLALGQRIEGFGITDDTYIVALGTGTGGAGTYTLNQSQSLSDGSGTYARTSPSTTLTVTSTAHGLTIGTLVDLDFTTGTGLDGVYEVVTTPTVDTFTVTTVDSTTTSGDVTIKRVVTALDTLRTFFAINWTVLPATDGAFQGGGTVDITDNFFVYNYPDTQLWAASDLLSPLTDPLSFASKDGSPDDLVSIIVDRREVYLLGEMSSEVWINSGGVPFPFTRIPGTSTQQGIAAQFSMARMGNSFAYVSKNNRGEAMIVRMNGYFPERISTHAVETTLVNQNVENAIAWTYQLEGHEVYVVSFPSVGPGGLTWAYDQTTGLWHKWLYRNNQNEYERHRGNCCAFFNQQVLVGDYENGKIYQLSRNFYTDDGDIIRRLRRAPHITSDLQRQYFHELQIQFQPGVGLSTGQGQDPQAMLRWSSDGGSTWSNEYWTSIGKQGKFLNRAIWRRLGFARDRVFEVSITDPVKAVIISANLKAEAGEN